MQLFKNKYGADVTTSDVTVPAKHYAFYAPTAADLVTEFSIQVVACTYTLQRVYTTKAPLLDLGVFFGAAMYLTGLYFAALVITVLSGGV